MLFHGNVEIDRDLSAIFIEIEFLLEAKTFEDVGMHTVVQVDSLIETSVDSVFHGGL